MTTTETRPAPYDDPEPTREDTWAGVAGAAALLAGTAHLVVTPHHLGEAPVLGVLFLLVGLAQVGLGLAFRLELAVRTLLLVLAVHVVLVAAFVASRTVELPFMPPHGAAHQIDHLPVAGGVGDGIPIYPGDRIEALGPVDLLCVSTELVVLLAVMVLLPATIRSRAETWLVTLAVLAVSIRAATWWWT